MGYQWWWLGTGRVLALDAKLNFDDSALFRRPEIVALRDVNEEDPLDVEASKHGLNYVDFDGTVGCMVNGAGLAVATMDMVKLAGGGRARELPRRGRWRLAPSRSRAPAGSSGPIRASGPSSSTCSEGSSAATG